MSNNKTEKAYHPMMRYVVYGSKIIDLQSRLATLQAENEKLWKLLEEKVKKDYWNPDEENKAWAAFQKANDLNKNG